MNFSCFYVALEEEDIVREQDDHGQGEEDAAGDVDDDDLAACTALGDEIQHEVEAGEADEEETEACKTHLSSALSYSPIIAKYFQHFVVLVDFFAFANLIVIKCYKTKFEP